MSGQEERTSAQKKRPRFSENAKNSSSFLAATFSPEVPAMWPHEPWLRLAMAKPASTEPVTIPVAATAPSPFGIAVVNPASTVPVTIHVAATALSPMATTPTPSPKAIAEREDGEILEQGGEAMAAMDEVEETVLSLDLKKHSKSVHCAACPAPLKPPIFQCGGGHAVCCDCGGACGGAATYTRVPCMDGLVGALELPCPYKKFGCGASIAYHAVVEHQARCAHAPCYCLECTPPFEGSPASLVRHLTDQSGRHRWPAPEKLMYGTGQWGDAVPLYTGELRVEGPPDEGEIPALTLYARVASCLVPGEVNMAKGQRLHAHVNPTMLHGESGEVHVRLCIVDGSLT
ncbi:unnamed protein product [Alopecurus aequalis]